MAHLYNFRSLDPGEDPSGLEMFKSLEFKASRKRSVYMSLAVHGVLLMILLAIPLIFTDKMKIKYDMVLLAPIEPVKEVREVTHYKAPPQPKPEPKPEKPLVAPPPRKPVVTQPPEV